VRESERERERESGERERERGVPICMNAVCPDRIDSIQYIPMSHLDPVQAAKHVQL
jgi:hypothetical protein